MQNAYVCHDETQGVQANRPQALWGEPWTEVL